MGVASASLLPYAPTPSEMAPAIRGLPPGPGQISGDPEKPSAMPVSSTAGPATRTRMRAPSPPLGATTSTTVASNGVIAVPATTVRAVHRIPAATEASGSTGSAAAAPAGVASASASAARVGHRSTGGA